ncbi:MAG: hypothetical protein HY815_13755 [Candidatus Riflebacteria bacterium]|nr:hypothetical protein [Candidatus Riflebacteria bacterium]
MKLLVTAAACAALTAGCVGASSPVGAPALDPVFLNMVRAHGIEVDGDPVARRLLAEYGSVFAAASVDLPPVVLFPDPAALERWQATVKTERVRLGDVVAELQRPAAEALRNALVEAGARGLTITARGKEGASRRSYRQASEFWAARVGPAVAHWQRKGRLSSQRAREILEAPIGTQVRLVLKEEAGGLHFATGFEKTILHSVAPPGASQHHTMLALDVVQFDQRSVREILARHGWHQTVPSDLPHFTYLGLTGQQLESRGLTPVTVAGRVYWIPRTKE